MTYREVINIEEEETLPQDIVLSQGPLLSPWITLGLAAILIAFVVYLLYSNWLRPAAPTFAGERSLLVLPEAPGRGQQDAVGPLSRGNRDTPMLQSRTLNALLGGAGPASTFDYDNHAPPRP